MELLLIFNMLFLITATSQENFSTRSMESDLQTIHLELNQILEKISVVLTTAVLCILLITKFGEKLIKRMKDMWESFQTTAYTVNTK